LLNPLKATFLIWQDLKFPTSQYRLRFSGS
jgi:hypothetical protein